MNLTRKRWRHRSRQEFLRSVGHELDPNHFYTFTVAKRRAIAAAFGMTWGQWKKGLRGLT